MASVAFEHVSKVYANGTTAVADCTLAVDDGELLVCVGPSGCGKSTLLRLLAGLETVSSGTLRIGDRAVNDLSPQERNVAMVFQDYALYPFMTVRANLEFPLRMRGLGRDEIATQVAWAAEVLELRPLLERLPKQLSGGQRQRVAMGRALVRQPAVSLLDEPLSNLDAKLRVEVRAEIAELQRRMRTTMIYVTHDQTEAMTLGHRIAVLDRGRLQQVAPPQELYDRPANAFVAAFIGNPPMNVFAASLLPTALRRDGAAQVGVRPEALHLTEASAADGIGATVEHVEFLGHETLAHVVVDGGAKPARLVVRLSGMHQLAPGDRVAVGVDRGHVHYFDQRGERMAARGE